jgi:hypothetical protein
MCVRYERLEQKERDFWGGIDPPRFKRKDRDFWHLRKTRLVVVGCSHPTINSNMSRAAEAAIAASYKSLKEDFVSNLTGGEIGEINYVTAVAPVRSSTLFTNSPDL